ncbi:MAG: hypothetical protein RL341_2541 [Pseudomonadota bacterium]
MNLLNAMLARADYPAAERLTLRMVAILALMLVVCALLLVIDSRTLDNGESVWLKPMRFCLAFGVHLLTIVWIGHLSSSHDRGDSAYAAGLWLQTVTVIIEMVCIGLQAARGVHSHFNYATPLDRAVFTVMGLGTAATLLGLLLCAWGVWRSAGVLFVRRVLLSAMILAILGGLVGVLMVMPTNEQRVLLTAGEKLPWIGGTAVGMPSGREVPFFHWDLQSGDWRTAHFVGLHALQALPLLAWLVAGVGAGRKLNAQRWAFIGACAYVALLLAVLVWTASGRSVLAIAAPGWWMLGAPLGMFAAALGVLVWSRWCHHVG